MNGRMREWKYECVNVHRSETNFEIYFFILFTSVEAQLVLQFCRRTITHTNIIYCIPDLSGLPKIPIKNIISHLRLSSDRKELGRPIRRTPQVEEAERVPSQLRNIFFCK